MTFRTAAGKMALGFAIGLFIQGVWMQDAVKLSIAFLFLGLSWLNREMDLGWDGAKKSWRFIRSEQVTRSDEHE